MWIESHYKFRFWGVFNLGYKYIVLLDRNCFFNLGYKYIVLLDRNCFVSDTTSKIEKINFEVIISF